MSAPGATGEAALDRGGALYTAPFAALCAIALLGFSSNFLLQPVLPILVLDRGGDATMVGVVIAAFSLPSVVLRPMMGRLADELGMRRILGIGAALMAVAGALYLLPSMLVLLANRVFHGTAWAAYQTGGNALLARHAPPDRRGEASGIYNLMPGIAQMLLPSVGLVLLATWGLGAPFLLSAALAAASLGLLLLARRLGGSRDAGRARPGGGLIERNALLPMVVELLFTSVSALFMIFPPVFARANGIPVGDLALYYPVYGGVLVAVRLAAGRSGVIDRFPRHRVIAAGAILAIVSLAVASGASTVAGLTAAGALYAAAAAFTSPTAMAMAIDRADPRRLGAAMATYSLGFQLALGGGAAVWGVFIDTWGYPSPYLGAAAVQVALLALLAYGARTRRRTA